MVKNKNEETKGALFSRREVLFCPNSGILGGCSGSNISIDVVQVKW